MSDTEQSTTEKFESIIARMREQGLPYALVYFDGSGDSGTVQEVRFVAQVEDVTADVVPEDWHVAEQTALLTSLGWIDPAHTEQLDALREDIDWCVSEYALSDGWEINDGSFGCAVVDSAEGCVHVHQGTRISDVEYETYVWKPQ